MKIYTHLLSRQKVGAIQLEEAIYRYLPAVIQEFHTHFLSYKPLFASLRGGPLALSLSLLRCREVLGFLDFG